MIGEQDARPGRRHLRRWHAQERIASLPLVGPSKETLATEHRHTLRDLNASFRVSALDAPTS